MRRARSAGAATPQLWWVLASAAPSAVALRDVTGTIEAGGAAPVKVRLL